jgi:hypothetical protein
MGVASPLWMRAIDTYGAPMSDHDAAINTIPKNSIHKIETETYRPVSSAAPQTAPPEITSGGTRR